MSEITKRPIKCTICDEELQYSTMNSPSDEAPSMLKFDNGTWVGFVQNEGSKGSLQMIAVCSEHCAQQLLLEN